MKIININGPINSGKSTISKLLKEKLSNCLFIEVDDLLSHEEWKKMKLTRKESWQEHVKRLAVIIAQEKQLKRYENIIFAYPMTDENYHEYKAWEDKDTKFINITLAPDLEICLQNRGNRELTVWEKNRIKQMYKEGYHCSKFADLIIDNGRLTPAETVQIITDYLLSR